MFKKETDTYKVKSFSPTKYYCSRILKSIVLKPTSTVDCNYIECKDCKFGIRLLDINTDSENVDWLLTSIWRNTLKTFKPDQETLNEFKKYIKTIQIWNIL
jgi:hypothetical protein